MLRKRRLNRKEGARQIRDEDGGQEQRDKNKEGARAEKEGNLWAFRGCDCGLYGKGGMRPCLK